MASGFTNSYDESSGQAFRQWIVKRPNNNREGEWHRRHSNLPAQNNPGKRVKGPRALVEMTIKVVAENFSFLEAEHLNHLPARLVYRIWEYMGKTQESLSFQSWKLCTKYILSDDPTTQTLPLKLFKYAIAIDQPFEPLVQYMSPLMSPSFDFIVHLTLTDCASFSTHEILSLPQLNNLGVLEIIQPVDEEHAVMFPRITDSVIREWASQPNPFPVLRVMKIWGDDFTTVKSLRYLSKFPALILYDVAGRRDDWKDLDQTSGWDIQRPTWSSSLFRTLQHYLNFLGAGATYDDWVEDQQSIVRNLVDMAGNKDQPVTKCGQIDQQSNQHMATEAKRYSINDATSFDLWGFILYSHIGKAANDQDLLALGLDMPDQAFVAGRLTLPLRPFVSLVLGLSSHTSTHKQSGHNYKLDCNFERQYTFIRSSYGSGAPENRPLQTPNMGNNSKRNRLSATSTNGRLKRQKWGNELFSEILGDFHKT
ncbi:hypothetical protein F5X99DRAFT_393548 [Biscogniauxia marginata]|nr:hypothetical protein F5X99DRAFT_393548 [Biscogniauxia marginata]